MSDKTYTADEVAAALELVVHVTLGRVLEALDEKTYGVDVRRGDDGNPKIRVVIDWKDVEKVIKELRDKKGDEE